MDVLIKRFLMRTRHSATPRHGAGRTSPRLRAWLHQSGCFRFQRELVARGVALGLLVGLTPTAGFQTALMLAGCLLIRGNFPAAFAVSWISNPLTWPPLYWLFHEIGQWLFDPWLRSLIKGTGWLDEALVDIMAVALGSLTLAIPVAMVGYLATLGASEVWHRRRHRARKQRRALTRQPPELPPHL